MKRCVILSAMDFDYSRLSKLHPDDLLICADNGYRHAVLLELRPELIIGDFDSLVGEISDIPVLEYDCDKDDTDTLLAVKYGMERGYRSFLIYGALGGRLDHTLASLQTLAYIHKNGGECELIGAEERVIYIENTTVKLPKQGRYISVVADSPTAKVTLKGLKFPLEDIQLTNTLPLGVSNQFAEDKCEITVKDGSAFIIICYSR